MDRRIWPPGHEPPRRLVSTCMFCRRLMLWRRERCCSRCLRRMLTWAAEIDADQHD